MKPPIGVWTHVAFIYDGVVRGYVDGREQLVTPIDSALAIGDVMNNLLLFIPLGFGLAVISQCRGSSTVKAIPLVFVLGAALSLCVEILQCWLPTRNPSLIDVASNSAGSILGAVLFFAGGYRFFTRPERVVLSSGSFNNFPGRHKKG